MNEIAPYDSIFDMYLAQFTKREVETGKQNSICFK